MRAVIQRVSSASVSVEAQPLGVIGRGLVVLLGIEENDGPEDLEWLAAKLIALRLFVDGAGAMNWSVLEAGGELLVISQFTLLASTKKGTRPSWHRAAKPLHAEALYQAALETFSQRLGRPVQSGRFGAMMEVALVNDGPVTLILDSKARE